MYNYTQIFTFNIYTPAIIYMSANKVLFLCLYRSKKILHFFENYFMIFVDIVFDIVYYKKCQQTLTAKGTSESPTKENDT